MNLSSTMFPFLWNKSFIFSCLSVFFQQIIFTQKKKKQDDGLKKCDNGIQRKKVEDWIVNSCFGLLKEQMLLLELHAQIPTFASLKASKSA